MPEQLLITGASGRIGALIRPLLRRPDRRLRLLDPVTPADLVPGEEHLAASITDARAMAAACAGADLVVHLGGLSKDRPWPEILDANINGTQITLEAARTAGVRRVLLASSAHAVGMTPAIRAADADVLPPRPDTFYGVGKVAAEALASVYADRYAMTIVSARIGTVEAEPGGVRSLSTWLSPADMVRLVEAALRLDEPGHHIVNAISRNTRRWMTLAAGERIGYHPEDDAEDWALLYPDAGPTDPREMLGGAWAVSTEPLGTTL
ncbi:NAD(P)-dependent oxidoreductase [Actinoplanes sp. OR16]|uniref:NAD-dependent epimerase/dehydratase family protein n=1 Tax=Actinoplanes sp. OR16 TaxID=946334 RepID=UPI001E3F621E|nr:NAD(P)-dependent oxidoreductase [Actinoplanes sp. OR16]